MYSLLTAMLPEAYAIKLIRTILCDSSLMWPITRTLLCDDDTTPVALQLTVTIFINAAKHKLLKKLYLENNYYK